jgi:membrane protease YdiL (CAAX protease family)
MRGSVEQAAARAKACLYHPAVTASSVALLGVALLYPSIWGTAGRVLYKPLVAPAGILVLAWRMAPPLAIDALLCLFAFRLAGRPSPDDSSRPITLWPPRALLWILGVVAFDYVTYLPIPAIEALRPGWFQHGHNYFPTHGWAMPLWFFWGTFGPAMEEILYRAYSPLVLERMRVPFYGCVLIPGFFFGFQHIRQGWPFALQCFLFGCAAGYAVLKTRNIWPALAPHLLYNLRVTIGMLLA